MDWKNNPLIDWTSIMPIKLHCMALGGAHLVGYCLCFLFFLFLQFIICLCFLWDLYPIINETFRTWHLNLRLLEWFNTNLGKKNNTHNTQLNPNPKQASINILPICDMNWWNCFVIKRYFHLNINYLFRQK